MNKQKTFYYGLIGLILILLIVELLTSKSTTWNKTFSRYDKNPWGSYALSELISGLFPDAEVDKSNLTYFEISENKTSNFLSISQTFFLDEQSFDSLLTHVHNGKHAFISSVTIAESLLDTLEVEMYDLDYDMDNVLKRADSSAFFIDQAQYEYYTSELNTYFSEFPDGIQILSRNHQDNPTTIKLPFGNGYFILNSTPIVFTNHFLLYEQNNRAVSSLLSTLPEAKLQWSEYYSVGKLESSTPLRAVLKNTSTKYALYMSVILIVIYILFDAKRRQRVIPIITAPANQTVQFVRTVGNLYLNTGNHKAAAINQINFFKEYLSLKLNVHFTLENNDVDAIATKASKDQGFVKNLLEKIHYVEKAENIPENSLSELNKDLHQFYSK